MAAQLVQTNPQDPVLDCSLRTAEAAALLITSLRGVAFAVPEHVDWETLLDLAQNHGVLLLVLQSLLENGVEVPNFFTSAARQCRASSERRATELEALLDGLAQQRIDVLPFKGPSMSLALYNDAALRSSNDLDLLVRDEDFPRAEAFLLGEGFFALGLRGEKDRRFRRRDLPVELHFELAFPRFLTVDVRRIWGRSRPGDFRGKPVSMMSKEDLVLYLCFHGLKHGFSRLIWITDVARALRGWPDRDYESLLLYARRQGLQPWLFIGCEVVRAMFPKQLPEAMGEVIALRPKAAQRARRAVARLFSEDLEGSVNDWRQVYLRAETSARQRWRHRQTYFAPTMVDYQWAHRHRIKPELMVVLRPFRLLEKYGFRKSWRALFPSRT
jgi:hypothetical protein